MSNAILTFCLLLLSIPLDPPEEGYNYPVPNERQLAFQDSEFGVIFHYDLHVFDPEPYRQDINRVKPFEDHHLFRPDSLDTDQWVATAKAAGAKFALITAIHETGFALFPSDVNPYSVKTLKWKDGKADIVADFIKSCRKFGIKPGIYVGLRWNAHLGIYDAKALERPGLEMRQQYYNRLCEGMVEELCTRYGELSQIWFDGGGKHPDTGGPEILPIVQKYQPNCLIYHNSLVAEARWSGIESGTVPYPCWASFPFPSASDHLFPDVNLDLLKYGDPDGAYWAPAVSDVPLRGYSGRHDWFWEPDGAEHIYPLENLVNMYYQSVGRNSTLVVGLGPDQTGRIPGSDVDRMKEFGKEIERRFASPLANASGKGNYVELRLPDKKFIDQIVLQEEISKGERVRQFLVEARINGLWETIATGTNIGHKHIITIPPVETDKVRLIVKKSVARPIIRNIEVHYIHSSPPVPVVN